MFREAIVGVLADRRSARAIRVSERTKAELAHALRVLGSDGLLKLQIYERRGSYGSYAQPLRKIARRPRGSPAFGVSEVEENQLMTQPYQNRLLGVVFDKWDFGKGSNIVVEIIDQFEERRFNVRWFHVPHGCGQALG